MQETSDFVLFLGRFHPLVVHLPIGFLLFAVLLEFVGRFSKNTTLTVATPLALLAGALSAALACILGYLLSLGGGYEQNQLDSHMWFGIFTTVLAFFAWLVKANKIQLPFFKRARPNIALLTLLVVILSVTGHYGGNLTHGSDYLVKYAPFQEKEEPLPALASLDEASVYPYLVKPVLEAKCVTCHNASKQKGDLAMHTFEALQKGGKGGPVLESGNLENSELYKRITLPENHEEFMPPEGKTPLTEQETQLLAFWIEQGSASDTLTFAQLDVPESIRQFAASQLGFVAGTSGTNTNELLDSYPLDENLLQELTTKGFQIRELVNGAGVLDVALPEGLVTLENSQEWENNLKLLVPLKNQILWLDLGGNAITDNHLQPISEQSSVKKMVLDNTAITDVGIKHLKDLSQLESINLYNNNVTEAILPLLQEMPKLKTVYVWGTDISDKMDTELELIGASK